MLQKSKIFTDFLLENLLFFYFISHKIGKRREGDRKRVMKKREREKGNKSGINERGMKKGERKKENEEKSVLFF